MKNTLSCNKRNCSFAISQVPFHHWRQYSRRHHPCHHLSRLHHPVFCASLLVAHSHLKVILFIALQRALLAFLSLICLFLLANRRRLQTFSERGDICKQMNRYHRKEQCAPARLAACSTLCGKPNCCRSDAPDPLCSAASSMPTAWRTQGMLMGQNVASKNKGHLLKLWTADRIKQLRLIGIDRLLIRQMWRQLLCVTCRALSNCLTRRSGVRITREEIAQRNCICYKEEIS